MIDWLFAYMEPEFDYFFKVILVGSTTANKVALLLRCCDDTYTDSPESTAGIEYKIKTEEVDGFKVKLQIWGLFDFHILLYIIQGISFLKI